MGRLPLVVAFAAIAACAKASNEQADAPMPPPRPVDAAIDGNGCTVQPCTILPQCGCGGVTSCDIDSSDNMGTACRSVVVPGRETDTCTALDRCDRGYVCLGNLNFATCKKYCDVDADCGTPRGRCAIEISSNGMPLQGIPPACTSNCDPLPTTQPAECPASYKCGLFTASRGGTQIKVTDCSPAGSGTQGASCKSGTVGNDAMCAHGYLCTTVNGGSTFECRRICNKTANTGCAGSQTCLGFNTPHTVDIEYGVCN